jgi:hypothetical protein
MAQDISKTVLVATVWIIAFTTLAVFTRLWIRASRHDWGLDDCKSILTLAPQYTTSNTDHLCPQTWFCLAGYDIAPENIACREIV